MTVNSDGIINRLLNAGVIIRGDRRGYYRMYQSDGSTGYLVSRERVLSEFAREVEYGRYQMREERFNEGVRFSRIARNTTLGAFIAAQNAAEAARPVLRTIRRNGYHISGGGINRDGLDLALEAIPLRRRRIPSQLRFGVGSIQLNSDPRRQAGKPARYAPTARG